MEQEDENAEFYKYDLHDVVNFQYKGKKYTYRIDDHDIEVEYDEYEWCGYYLRPIGTSLFQHFRAKIDKQYSSDDTVHLHEDGVCAESIQKLNQFICFIQKLCSNKYIKKVIL